MSDLRYREVKRRGGFQVDDKSELRGPLDGQIAGLLTAPHLSSVVRLRQDRSGTGLIGAAGAQGAYCHDRTLSFLELCLFGKGADVP